MSVTRLWEIVCDGCGEPFDDGDVYLTDLRKRAHQAGWRSGIKKDWCPDCWTKEEYSRSDVTVRQR